MKKRFFKPLKYTGIVCFIIFISALALALGILSKKPDYKGPKLIVLGLDGADWDIINHYIELGKLSTFARLKKEGSWGYLQSFEPTLSPMLWTTIATGKPPDEHGIVDFLDWDTQKKERLPVTSQQRKVPAIWNILSHHGLKVGIFNWLVSWPAEKVNGVMISDRLGYHIFPRVIGPRLTLEQVSYPLNYAEKKSEFFSAPENISYEELSEFIQISKEEFAQQLQVGQYDVQNPDMNLRLALTSFKTFQNLALDYWKQEKPPFLALYFDIPDTLEHTFMEYAPPKLKRIPIEKFQKYENGVSVTYEKIDHFLEKLLKTIDAQTHLLILSDHGFKFGKDRPADLPAAIGKEAEVHWHDNEGIVLFWGNRFQKNKQILAMTLYDVVPTILNFFNLALAQDMTGKVISSVYEPEYFRLDQIQYTASYNEVAFGLTTQAQTPLKRSTEIDQFAKDRLASLGYINPTEEKKDKNRYQTRNPFLEAYHLERAGHIDEAVKLYLNILKNKSDSESAVSIYNSLALIYRNKGNYEKAKSYIQKAIKENKKLSSLYINLGNIEKQFGYTHKAFRAYKEALKINPNDGMAHYAMGLLFEQQKKWSSAEGHYKAALELKVDKDFLPNQLMAVIEKQNKTEELKRMREHFSLQKSPQEKLKFFMGESQKYMEQNRLSDALEALFEALRLQPKNAVLYNDIGAIFLKQNNKQKAVSYFKRALELDAGYATSYLNLASTYLETDQPLEAKKALSNVFKLEPQNKHAYFLLGLAQLKLNENKLARFNFQKALMIDPSFTAAREHLKKLSHKN